jgi:hypothetical protein
MLLSGAISPQTCAAPGGFQRAPDFDAIVAARVGRRPRASADRRQDTVGVDAGRRRAGADEHLTITRAGDQHQREANCPATINRRVRGTPLAMLAPARGRKRPAV